MAVSTSFLEVRLLTWMTLAYLTFKLILVPGIVIWKQTTEVNQTQKITVKVPEIAVTDLGLVLIILSFSPTTARLLRSLRVNHQGFQADFKGTKPESKPE